MAITIHYDESSAICGDEYEKLKVAHASEVYAQLPSDEQRRWIDAVKSDDTKSAGSGESGSESGAPEDGIGYGRERS